MSSSVPSAAEAAKNESVRDVEFRDEIGDELDAEVTKCEITHTIFFKALWTKAR